MFKNVMMYRMLSPWTVTAAQLEAALESARYVECTGSQEKAVGWVEPRGKANGALVEVVGGEKTSAAAKEAAIVGRAGIFTLYKTPKSF